MLLRWWILMTAVTAGLGVSQYYFDIWDKVNSYDFTGITWMILVVFYACSAYVGWLIKKTEDQQLKQSDTSMLWFNVDFLQALGLAGTLIGIMYVLIVSFNGLQGDSVTADNIKSSIVSVAAGMGTAIVTTLAGIAASQLLKYQITRLESNR